MSQYLESLYSIELEQNIAVQNWSNGTIIHSCLVLGSEMVRSKNLFIYVIPLFAAISHQIYVQALTLLALSEYSTLLIKFIVPETRPIWWALDNGKTLQNGKSNCEPSSGFPSGHVLVATVFLFTCIKYSAREIRKFNEKKIVQILPTIILSAIIILLVTLSRMNQGVHFLHQCIAGAVIGYGISELYFKRSVNKYIRVLPRLRALILVLALSLLVVVMYYGKKLLGFNPDWDIEIARKHCDIPDNVYTEKTTYYGFCCTTGLLFGLALAAPLKLHSYQLDPLKSFPASIIVMIIHRLLLLLIPINHGNFLIYFLTVLTYCASTFLLASFIPKTCQLERKTILPDEDNLVTFL